MRITLLGTGCPQCHPDRLGPANLVRHGPTSVLVDCGSGATQRLVSAGCSGAALDAVFLTHLHSDHVVDLYQLIVSSWHQGRSRPQRVFGPKGTRAHIDGLMALWRPERELRIAHEQRPSTAAFTIDVTEIAPDFAVALGEITIRAVPVEHFPVTEAYGFVFEAEGRRAVFSGDTRRSADLTAAAAAADVLVHECFVHRELMPVPGHRSEETIAAVASYHTLSSEVGKVAAEAGARVLMLNHFVPAEVDRAALVDEVARDYPGPIIVGEDLMTYDLRSGVLTHRQAHMRLGSGPIDDRIAAAAKG